MKKLVCLGGGVGTANLLTGLKKYTTDLTTIISMADDGGSAGRLRRLYNVLPPGDLVSCMSVMAKDPEGFVKKLLTYRFNGERYGKDHELGGHKVGNLLMVALKEITGSYESAIEKFKELFEVEGNFYPATEEPVNISALTVDGLEVFGEEKIDLGKYRGKRILEKVFLHPATAHAGKKAIDAILSADAVIVGPGDLYTNLLPVLIVTNIAQALRDTKAKKLFIVNVANKPFETRGYNIIDFIHAIQRHIGDFPFTSVIANNDTQTIIPKELQYKYVPFTETLDGVQAEYITEDLVDPAFPIYHSPDKLAKVIINNI